MYVCVCRAVSDKDIKKMNNKGGLKVRDIQRCTGAGTQCGACIKDLRKFCNTTNTAKKED